VVSINYYFCKACFCSTFLLIKKLSLFHFLDLAFLFGKVRIVYVIFLAGLKSPTMDNQEALCEVSGFYNLLNLNLHPLLNVFVATLS
jgi:hypothetical protein